MRESHRTGTCTAGDDAREGAASAHEGWRRTKRVQVVAYPLSDISDPEFIETPRTTKSMTDLATHDFAVDDS